MEERCLSGQAHGLWNLVEVVFTLRFGFDSLVALLIISRCVNQIGQAQNGPTKQVSDSFTRTLHDRLAQQLVSSV